MSALSRSSLRLLFALFIASLLYACSSTRIGPPTQEERIKAAEYGITAAYTLERLVGKCESMTSEVRELAEQTQQRWWQRNWPLVDAADKEYQAYIKDQQLKFGKETGMLPALKFVMEMKEEANKLLFELTKHKVYREDRCERALAEYEKPEMQLADNPVMYAHLNFLRNYFGDKISKPHSVPVFDTPYEAKIRTGGKHLYNAEKLAERQTCDDYTLLGLLHSGPEEVYGMYCKDGTNFLIKCQWGRCQISND